MRTTSALLCTALACLLLLTACDSTDAPPDDSEDPVFETGMAALIDGKDFETEGPVFAVRENNVLTINGHHPDGQKVRIVIQPFTGSGTYTLHPAATEMSFAEYDAAGSDEAGTYQTADSTAGSVTIGTVTDQGVAGRFNFLARNFFGGAIRLTEGVFKASFDASEQP